MKIRFFDKLLMFLGLFSGLFALYFMISGPVFYFINGWSYLFNKSKIDDDYVKSTAYVCDSTVFLEMGYYKFCYSVDNIEYEKSFIQHIDFYDGEFLDIYYKRNNPKRAFFYDEVIKFSNIGLFSSLIVMFFMGAIVFGIYKISRNNYNLQH